MQTSLEHKVLLGFLAAVGLLLLSGGAAWFSATSTTARFAQVDHTHRVLYQIESVLTDLLNMQSATRGYLLTGEERFLEPYHQGRARIETSLGRLETLITDHPAQQERSRDLADAARSATENMRDRILARRGQDFSAAAQAEALAEGKSAMDRVRRTVARMQQEERDLLAARSREAGAEARRTFWVTAVGGSLALVVIGAAVFWVRRDLRARLAAEAERDRFFNLSLDLLCVADADGYFKRVNPAFTQALGWSEREMLARPLLDFVHPDDHAATQREVERQVRAGQPVLHFENRYRAKDGGWRILSWRSMPEGSRMFATARDVTAQKLAEDEIRRLHADLEQRAGQLEAVNRELEAFSYSVSHDLRAPLRHIDGFASLLQKNAAAQLDATARRHLDFISGAARQMGRLIDDLLTFSRMGRSALRPARVDQSALVAAVVREGRYAQSHPAVAWRIDPLPAAHGDPAMLRQVWTNLIDNAVKYSAKTSRPRIEISAYSAGAEQQETVYFVRDNGAGFDPRYIDKLFGVFQRLHSANEFEGTGIGLANVRRIIARHGGRTWAEGRPGTGATFYFSLPVCPPSPGGNGHPPPELTEASPIPA